MIQNYIYRGLSPLLLIFRSKRINALLFFLLIIVKLYPNDFVTIENNVRNILWDEYKPNIVSTTKIPNYLTTNGKYNNIDYKDNDMVNWAAYNHIERLFYLTITYTHPSSKEKGNKIIIDNIIEGLKYWVRNKPTSKNWWFNKIAVPQKISEVLILLNGEASLDKNLQAELISLTSYELGTYSGTNRLQMAMNQFLIGVVDRNTNSMISSRNEIFSTLKIGSSEGIQYDYSFHSHGKQLYTYGYGSSFIKSVLNFCLYIRGTKFEIDQEKLAVLNNYILKGYLPIIRNDYVDYNATGRALSRKNALRSNDKSFILSSLSKINSNFDILEEIETLKRDNVYINRYYWTSDYLIHSTPSIYFSVRGVSNRTRKAEKGNNENLKGGNLSLGSVSIRSKGDEYYNIFSTWDWDMIPGTTTISGQQKIEKEWGIEGNTSFVGGLSIPNYSIMTYNMDDKGIRANKAYFFFHDIMLCLGTSISANTNKEVYTTINQCFLDKNIDVYSQGNKLQLPFYFNIEDNKINKIVHKNILYYFPNNTNLKIKTERKKGRWSDINISGNKSEESSDILSIIISHGNKVKNASYEYITAPLGNNIEDHINKIDILANNDTTQAVLDKKDNVVQIIFLKPSAFNIKGNTLKVNKPVTIIIKNFDKTDFEIFVSDPTQKLENVSIKYNNKDYNVILPSGIYAGATKKIEK